MGHRGGVRRRDPQAGETLIEIICAVALMGIAITGVLGGVLGLAKSSNQISNTTRASYLATAYAEQLKQPVPAQNPSPPLLADADVLAYRPCATATGATKYPAFSGPRPTGWTVTVDSVEHATGITSSGVTWGSPNALPASCSGGTDSGLQRITVVVRTEPGADQAVESVRLVKRDARCSNAYSPLFVNLDQGPC